jgi:hypothetical protein
LRPVIDPQKYDELLKSYSALYGLVQQQQQQIAALQHENAQLRTSSMLASQGWIPLASQTPNGPNAAYAVASHAQPYQCPHCRALNSIPDWVRRSAQAVHLSCHNCHNVFKTH